MRMRDAMLTRVGQQHFQIIALVRSPTNCFLGRR